MVTVRKHGRSIAFESGTQLPLEELHEAAFSSGARTAPDRAVTAKRAELAFAGSASPLFDLIREREAEFDEALARRDGDAATGAALALETDLHDWSTDIPGQDELIRARASIRAMVQRLGSAAVAGLHDPRELVGPYIELLIDQRAQARGEGRFGDADRIRDDLESLGVELRDDREATEWTTKREPDGQHEELAD